jgi:putative zinc finger protein
VSENDSASASDHPGPENIAAYLSGGLGVDDRARLEAHLARCRACRRQVTSAHALLRSRPRPMRWVAAAAVAALAIALIGPWSFRGANRPTSPDIERAAPGGTETPAIVALTPIDGDTISATTAVFAWRPHGRDVLYRLSVTDGQGRAVWTTDTADTSIALPPNVRLTSGTRYYWYVDAVGANAVSWTTGTRVFMVAP